MAIGERIRFMRNLKGMTQKQLGMQVGFSEKTADIRMAQYESGTRTPKEELTKALAYVLGVSPMALSVPDIESYFGVMHTLFALEDLYGLKIDMLDGEACIRIDPYSKSTLKKCFAAWQKEAEKYRAGEISKEDYDKWRYNYPEYDISKTWIKLPPKEISDVIVKAFKDKWKE